MNKTQYFFLMLKQGMKGVFHFKAQFTIILVLTFLATGILSLSLSTGRRIQESYDQIVGKVDPFAYEQQIRVGFNANSSSSTSTNVMPLNSFINSDYTALYFDDNDPMNASRTNYNYILSHPETYAKREQSLSFNGQKVAYPTNHSNFINQAYWKTNFLRTFIQDFPEQSDIIKQKNTLRNELLTTLLADLNRLGNGETVNDNNLKYTPMGQYTLKHPGWWKQYTVFDDRTKTYEIADWVDNLDTRQERLDGNNFQYFYYLVQSLNLFFRFLDIVREDLNPFIEAKYNKPMNNAQLYALVFGDDPSKGNIGDIKVDPNDIDPNWIIKDDGSNQYDIWMQASKSKNDYVFLNQETDDTLGVRALLAKNGLKGVISPFINANFADATDWSTVSSANYIRGFTNNLSEAVFQIMKVFDDPYIYKTGALKFNGNTVGDTRNLNVVFTLFNTSHKLAAEVFDYKFKLRREATYFDAPKSISYRGIALDDEEDYNFTILKGRGISNDDYSSEVVLSEQFARFPGRKLEISSLIHIGGGSYFVTGLGTDAFSFLPSQDILNPIPNPRISSFVYARGEVLGRMFSGSGTAGNETSTATQTLTLLYWDQGPASTKEIRQQAYFAGLNASARGLNRNQDFFHKVVDNQKVDLTTSNVNTGVYALTGFNDSNYRYSWQIAPFVVKAFLSITAIASAVIIIIVLFSLVICIRKTIHFNSKQIGILKAMGSTPREISVSYISYSIVIILLAIPLGWITGNLLQIPFANMFETYFSIYPDNLFFDWTSFVIIFFVVGVFSAIIGYVSAYILTNTSVMKILETSVKWHSSRFFNWLTDKPLRNAKFKVRFSLTLANAGSYQIWLMSLVILVTSILVTVSLVIPSVAQTSNRLYYRNIHYANEYNDTPLTVNAPLSKTTISYWTGHDALEQDYEGRDDHRLILDTSGNRYGYYKTPESYFATISNSMALPEYYYRPAADGKTHQIDNALLDLTKTSNDTLLTELGDIFGNNFYNNINSGFSIGMIDALYGVVLHSLETVIEDNQDYWTDEEKISYSQDFSAWLTNSVPRLIAAVIDSTGAGFGKDDNNEGGSWKQQIMNVLYGNLPSYVRQFVDRSDSRLDQFAITYQSELVIPGNETLVTTVNGKVNQNKNIITSKNENMSLTGLDKNQNSIELSNKEKDKVYLPNDILRQIYQVLDEPNFASNITYNGKRIFDANSQTLTLPILPNRQAQSYYHLNKDSLVQNFISNIQALEVHTNSDNEPYRLLPQNAWIYDDTSYVNLNKANSNFEWSIDWVNPKYEHQETTDKYYLSPYEIDNNKFSFKSEYVLDDNGLDQNKLVDRAFMFKNFILDRNQKVQRVFTRPYYQYKDLKLMVPKSIIGDDLNDFLYPSGKSQTADPTVENNSWYSELEYNQVPDSVKAAWNNQTGNYLVLNPYDLKYWDANIEKDMQAGLRSGLDNLLGQPTFWYRFANTGGINPPLRLNPNAPRVYANKNLKVNLEAVGSINSFNSNLVVIDSNLANKLLGMPLTRHYQYNYQIFGNEVLKAGQPDKNNYVSQFDRYAPRQEVFGENVVANQTLWKPFKTTSQNQLEKGLVVEDYAPHLWNTGKLSNLEEPLSFSSSVSYVDAGRLGINLIGRGSWSGTELLQLVQTSSLLSEQRALITQITSLAIAVGSLLIVVIILTSSLLVMLVGDIYIAQYRRFMVLMKSLGYSNAAIMAYSLGTATVFAVAMLVAGNAIGWVLVAIVVRSLDGIGFALPFGFNWWVLPLFLFVMLFSYFVSLTVSSAQARHDAPTKVLAQTAE